MALLGYSVPETLTDDAGNAMKGITVTVTGPSAYSGTAVSDATTGVLRLGPLPPGDYTVTYGSRSVTVPIVVSLPSGGTSGQVVSLSGSTPAWSDPASSGQPLDSDLTAIAALDSTTAGALATDGAGWIRKTYAQLKTALALTKSDVGLGNVDNTSDVNKPVSTAVTAAIAAQATTDRGTYAPLVADWTASTAYTVGQLVTNGGQVYRVSTAHTSTGSFDATKFTSQGGTSLASTFTSKTSAYTAAAGDFIECDTTTAGFTVTLPTNPSTGALVAVKKVSNDANTLTIAAAGGGTIDGSATTTTATQWAGLLLEHKGSNVWRVTASMSTTGPQGPIGATGATGPAGPTGAAGSGTNSWYGDGSDGAFTADGSATMPGASRSGSVYTLSRNVYFTDLTVNSGVTIKTNGWIVNANGTLTNNGTIKNNGGIPGAGATTASSTAPGSDGSGTGNLGGSSGATANMLGYGRAGGLANGTAGTASALALGGSGGAGGASGTAAAGGAGGTAAPFLGIGSEATRLVQYSTVAAWSLGSPTVFGGGGGGGAGNDGVNQGGGGGGGGGVLVVNARLIVNNGVIQARGAAGANAVAGSSGGGGGGGGGVVFLNTMGYSGSGSYDANGGAGGTAAGAGVNGTSGSAGTARLYTWA